MKLPQRILSNAAEYIENQYMLDEEVDENDSDAHAILIDKLHAILIESRTLRAGDRGKP